MVEDKLLILRFKYGSSDALRRIYEKYKDYLLKIAIALLHDVDVAEDVVQDVFVRFAQSENKITLRGSLKGYLRTCVVNSAFNKNREKRLRPTVGLDEIDIVTADLRRPDRWIIREEESKRIGDALAQIPYRQREVIVLHLHGGMKFKQIAKLQTASIKTIQSRYRYGLEKIRIVLNSEMKK